MDDRTVFSTTFPSIPAMSGESYYRQFEDAIENEAQRLGSLWIRLQIPILSWGNSIPFKMADEKIDFLAIN